ncbi:hypothetical protein A3C20_02435 [Candidatus Kaiserbacteria bacterium RIFCSPHIGHO2_02_FULL_55_25]|uniref:Uncharacterized protein n=1 Tax=Candidatus Kaiserbacteria bacterium RIFCSPHIGHO2_02_FULL_55_25 TaxID=1798498 RepID=A0A1F6E804_9BACT|nr:MAG: hypothetical protein A3C20_02435 [Candidatus Kaiserbacteria bacterium RIFCSPHIGHO2_02_FULL_55_25]OGG77449.1 MAG: hypothetical protein A3F56_02255 [Candidatus Kaiserbacteria bacterium RIFCSPHIGHO2_12_FULL_55_13]
MVAVISTYPSANYIKSAGFVNKKGSFSAMGTTVLAGLSWGTMSLSKQTLEFVKNNHYLYG